MDRWKGRFEGIILERGLKYYEINSVNIFHYSSEFFEAVVMGTYEYHVKINFDDSKIMSMYCDCPYHANCKHMAATLYYIEDHPELLKKYDYRDLLTKFSHGDLIDFLSEELNHNPDLLNKMRLYKNEGIDESFYINKLNQSLNSPFLVLKFIDVELWDLFRYEQLDLFFRLCEKLIDYVEELSIGGRFDDSEMILDRIDDYINRLVGTPNEYKAEEFLRKIILSNHHEFILNLFTDTYSRIGDVEQLFIENGDELIL